MNQKKTLTQSLLEFFGRNKSAGVGEFIKSTSENSSTVYSLVNRLKRLGLLKKVEEKRGRALRHFFHLTEKGKERVISINANMPTPPKPPKVWDGVWRLIVFDIPEEERGTRDYLRYELKSRGFYMLQLSVWITPYEVGEELREIIDEIGARYYVRYMIVKEINEERDMLHHFELK